MPLGLGLVMTAPALALLSVPAPRVYLLSERCSGSNWLTSMISATVEAQKVQPCLCAYKHFFQLSCDVQPGCLVVVLARNVYDWLASFHRSPWNAPSHQELSFEAFLRKSWQLTPREGAGRAHPANATQPALLDTRNGCPTRERLVRAAHDQWPVAPPNKVYRLTLGCRPMLDHEPAWRRGLPQAYCGLAPAYEAKLTDGSPFENVVKMRSGKLHNYLSILRWYKGPVELVSYDRLVSSGEAPLRWLHRLRDAHGLRLLNGTAQRLAPVLSSYKGGGHENEAGAARLTAPSPPPPPSPDGRARTEAEQGAQDVCSSTSAWTPALLCFVNQQLDWAVEAAFGFQPSWTFQDCNGTVSALRC